MHFIATVEEAYRGKIREITLSLETAGVRVREVLPIQGIITGEAVSADQVKINGIAVVEEDRKWGAGMTIAELDSKLKALHVPTDNYYLHGLYGSANDDDKLALTVRKSKRAPEYEVYFKERGEKHSTRIFHSEDEACQYIYRLLSRESGA